MSTCNFDSVTDPEVKKALKCLASQKGITKTQLEQTYNTLKSDIDVLKQSVGTSRKYQSTYTTDAEKAGFGETPYSIYGGNPYDTAKQLEAQAKQGCDPSKQDCTGKRVSLVQDKSDTFDFSQKNLKFYGGARSGQETYRKFKEKYCYGNGQYITF
jgi:hypothetical protein